MKCREITSVTSLLELVASLLSITRFQNFVLIIKKEGESFWLRPSYTLRNCYCYGVSVVVVLVLVEVVVVLVVVAGILSVSSSAAPK